MNIVVNGASGYIGFHLVKKLLEEGNTVYAVCGSSSGFLTNINNQKNLIILSKDDVVLEDKLKNSNASVWYQIAWHGACGKERSNPVLQLQNEIMSVKSLQFAESIGCKKIIFTGTVYENLTESILANQSFNSNSFYILAKKHTYELTYQLSKSMNIEYVWVQFCHPVGTYMNENQLIPYAIKCFVNNQPSVFGPCNQYFDIISVEYLVDSLIILGKNKSQKNKYYIGSGNPKLLKEYIKDIADVCHYDQMPGIGRRPDDGLVFNKEWFDNNQFVEEYNPCPDMPLSMVIERLCH